MMEERLRHNLEAVQERLAAACRRARRAPSDVTLVAVTKAVKLKTAAYLSALGVRQLGESRPQELARKAAALPAAIEWHLIGHLQRNKIEPTLAHVSLIHSVDSARLLQALDNAAGKQGKSVQILLQVNASGEHSKHGFAPAELPPLIPIVHGLRHVRVTGLMTMAAPQEAEKCRPAFALLRKLRDRHRPELDAPHSLEHLSMGMSNDFEVAVEEGATLVRLGSVLFDGVESASGD
jgi:pyridoxal phosphate enzyme (YggS family)